MSAADKSLEATTAVASEAPSPIASTSSEISELSSNIPVNYTESHIDVPQFVSLLPPQVQPFWE